MWKSQPYPDGDSYSNCNRCTETYANSAPCSPDDPEFNRIAGVQ